MKKSHPAIRIVRKLFLPAVIVMALATTGCVASPESDSGDITIVWWDRMDTEGQKQTIATWISGFEAANPGIKIDRTYMPPDQYRQSVLTAAAGGSAPDLILYDSIDTAGYAEAGILADMSKYFDNMSGKEHFVPGVIDGGRYDGGLYQIPYNVHVMGLFANSEILSAVGASEPATLDELANDFALASAGGFNGVSAAFATPFASYTFTPILYSLGVVTTILIRLRVSLRWSISRLGSRMAGFR